MGRSDPAYARAGNCTDQTGVCKGRRFFAAIHPTVGRDRRGNTFANHQRLVSRLPRPEAGVPTQSVNGEAGRLQGNGTNHQPTLKVVCVDKKVQWSEAGNIWHNAAIRSAVYLPIHLSKRLFRKVE
jgi:hypothetical protein